jgi:flavin reductase (DIM6/NTAB) family NADH-FMN oxidoreductase RutF
VIKTVEIGLHTQFIGEIMDIKIDETILVDGKPDMGKLKPFIYAPELRSYFAVGRELGKAFSIGKGK